MIVRIAFLLLVVTSLIIEVYLIRKRMNNWKTEGKKVILAFSLLISILLLTIIILNPKTQKIGEKVFTKEIMNWSEKTICNISCGSELTYVNAESKKKEKIILSINDNLIVEEGVHDTKDKIELVCYEIKEQSIFWNSAKHTKYKYVIRAKSR